VAPPATALSGSTGSGVAATPPTQAAAEPALAADLAEAAQPTDPDSTVPTTPTASTSPTATTVPEVSDTVASPAAEAATVSAQAARLEPECALEYEAASGDSWYRIADAAGVTVDELLDVNLAELDAPIYPGDEICLPEGATMPAPSTTTTTPVTPSTTSAPSTTVAPTTVAPSTTAPSVTAPLASPDEVQQLIREIWPEELHEKALQVAWRESNYRANAHNGWCCYGVFQLYWTVHRSWLDDFGINSTADLYDARKNITAAYALYQRSGGWGPWGG
jgi:LysM repeat protein